MNSEHPALTAARTLPPKPLASPPIDEGKMMSIRELFAKEFGEREADRIEASAEGHANGTNSENRGDDPFKWALLICIGFECMSKDKYREHHGIKTPWNELRQWIIDHADLASHNGDCDYLCALSGGYDEFVKPEPALSDRLAQGEGA